MKFLNRLKTKVAFIITLMLALAFLVCWLCLSSSHDWAGLWLNLSAGFFVSLCTIFFIDRLIKQQKAREELPLRLTMYRDVQVFTSRLISLWERMYIQSAIYGLEVTVEQLFSRKTIGYIYHTLDLEGRPFKGSSQDWFSYIDNSVKDLIARGNSIIDRYAFIAEPILSHAIHHLINDSPFVGILEPLKAFRINDRNNNWHRLPMLHCYNLIPNKKDYKTVRALISWCRTQYICLVNFDSTIREIDNHIITLTDEQPTSIMTSVKKASFNMNYPVRIF